MILSTNMVARIERVLFRLRETFGREEPETPIRQLIMDVTVIQVLAHTRLN